MKITAELLLRQCTPDDLVQWQEGERKTLSRQRFYIRTDNKLECYTLSNFSDKRTVLQFINEGRCFIPVIEDLDPNTCSGRVVAEHPEVAAA
jgi:hypothetical protein